MNQTHPIVIIGAGLAGSECAYQLLKASQKVCLIEMRPIKNTPAHHSDLPAELVCSNSFRGIDVKGAVGLLKEEMAKLDSLTMMAAQKTKVPAGGALAVDRDAFSQEVFNTLKSFSNLTYLNDVVLGFEKQGDDICVLCESGKNIIANKVVVATGPLTDEKLASWIIEQTGKEYLYFYDAIAPIIEKDSIDFTKAFRASRYAPVPGQGSRLKAQGSRQQIKSELSDTHDAPFDSFFAQGKQRTTHDDYINCPLTKDEYYNFVKEIQNADVIPVKEFDDPRFFDGCLPIEEMARRGDDVLRYGPLKPVGLRLTYEKFLEEQPSLPAPRPSGPPALRPCGPAALHAVIQLRQDNLHDSLYNMVGFQTRMKHGEQQRIFKMIPGLENAKFARLGSMHRNTFMCSPILLSDGCELKSFSNLYFAGQMTGCEGYVESAAMGLYVGKHIIDNEFNLPATTALGALVHHVLKADPAEFQPMNINYGLFDPLEEKVSRKLRKEARVERAREVFDLVLSSLRRQGSRNVYTGFPLSRE